MWFQLLASHIAPSNRHCQDDVPKKQACAATTQKNACTSSHITVFSPFCWKKNLTRPPLKHSNHPPQPMAIFRMHFSNLAFSPMLGLLSVHKTKNSMVRYHILIGKHIPASVKQGLEINYYRTLSVRKCLALSVQNNSLRRDFILMATQAR